MKKFLPICLFLISINLVAAFDARTQGIYQLWGNTVYGGAEDDGVLFSTRFDGTAYTSKKEYTVTNSGNAEFLNKPVACNGKLYTVMYYGGIGSNGIIAEFDPATNVWTKRANLYTAGVAHSGGSLVLYNNKLYGIASGGSIFEFNPLNNNIQKIHETNDYTAGGPTGTLAVYNNKFYGVGYGGSSDDGVIFEFDPVTHAYAKKYDFDEPTTGKYPSGELTVYNGKLWGTTIYGGQSDGGTLYVFDPATATFSKKKDLSSVNLAETYSRLTILNNKLYGSATRKGASNVFGGIFEYDPAANLLIKKMDYDYTTAHFGVEFTAYNNKLYATSSSGGQDNEGVLFSFDPATNTYQTLIHLISYGLTHGVGPVTFFNGKCYGFARNGGMFERGGMFAYDPMTTAFSIPVHLGGAELYNPTGEVVYYNHKIWGTTSRGGAHQQGGIYAYDPTTGIYTIKYSFTGNMAHNFDQGGLTVYNNKFYGVTHYGGNSGSGVLYEYDPATNALLIKHHFEATTGTWPHGKLAVFNGKLYGACRSGGVNNYGNIFEFDPATGTYNQKVIMSANFGCGIRGSLTFYNNRFYGVASGCGINSAGTLFEYNPAINSFIKKADFDGSGVKYPFAGLTVFNGMLYGTSFAGGQADSGTIYQYDPTTALLTKKIDLNYQTGVWPHNQLTVQNNKLYGTTSLGGSHDEGTLFQYDPATNLFTKRLDFNVINGARGIANNLAAVPARTAPGAPGSCMNTQTVNINAANAHEWIPFTDAEGRAVAEINANGNILGNTAVRVFVNDGNIRQHANGLFYLDRNITITPTHQPTTAVSVRLYVRRSEFESLKATAGSGVVVPSDLAVYKNSDFCTSTMNSPFIKLPTVKSDWASDYVYATNVTSFSSFYFAAGTPVVLPIHLLSFSGQKEGPANRLQWKAACTNGVNFTVERSADGMQFSSIGLVMATAADCDRTFIFPDAAPLAKSWYRLQLKEDNGAITYSSVVFINRSGNEYEGIKVQPNPVTGGTAQLSFSVVRSGNASLSIVDMTGRVLRTSKLTVHAGTNSVSLDTRSLPAGIYGVVLDNGESKETARFIKE